MKSGRLATSATSNAGHCYQEGIRTAGNVPDGYDVEAMLRALDEIGEPFSLFGGEIMMVRRADLKRLLAFGLQRYGGTKLQTNATLIEEADLALFRDYAVRVGISIDGPGGLNDARWAGTFVATRRATARTEAVIETLCHEGTPPTIIITLHRLNTQGACLDILLEWLGFLDGLGVRRARAHFLEIDNEFGGGRSAAHAGGESRCPAPPARRGTALQRPPLRYLR